MCDKDLCEKISVLKQLAQGLVYLHYDMGISHLDIQPMNIRIDEESDSENGDVVVKVIDFDSVCVHGEDVDRERSLGSRWTSSAFNDPRAALSGPHCDVYSFGCVVGYVFSEFNVPFATLGDLEILSRGEGLPFDKDCFADDTPAQILSLLGLGRYALSRILSRGLSPSLHLSSICYVWLSFVSLSLNLSLSAFLSCVYHGTCAIAGKGEVLRALTWIHRRGWI